MKKALIYFTVFICCHSHLEAQFLSNFSSKISERVEKDPLARVYLTPQRIVSKTGDSSIINADLLLQKGNSQAYFENRNVCRIINKGDKVGGLVLDFGKEIHGGIQITTSQSNRVTRKVRVRFGESVLKAPAQVKIIKTNS